jgi:hypothetical protein
VDAETLAAWSDGTLRADAARTVEAHLAGCARCQSLLAAFVRTDPTSERAHAAAGPVFDPSAPNAHGPDRFWRRWRLAWLAPVAASAAALAIWVATPRTPLDPRPSGEEARQEQQSPMTAPGAEPGRNAPGERALLAPPAPSADRIGSANESLPAVAPEARQQAADAPLREAVERDTRRADADASPRDRAAAATPPAPAMPPGAASSAGPVRGLVITATGGVQWRIRVGPEGASADFTDDGGRSWVSASIPVDVLPDIEAGVAAGGRVCWLVGRQGLVLLSSDGPTFRRLPFPEAADLRTVEASDARRAIVVAADGRQFSTADGGLTWTAAR